MITDIIGLLFAAGLAGLVYVFVVAISIVAVGALVSRIHKTNRVDLIELYASVKRNQRSLAALKRAVEKEVPNENQS